MEQKELEKTRVILKGCHLKEGTSKAGKPFAIIEVFTDQDSYSLWLKKKDGTETKSYTQLKAMGNLINKRVGVTFTSKDGSYLNKHTGMKVEKQDRTIMWFEDIQAEHEQGKPERDVEEGMAYTNDPRDKKPDEPITNEEHDINLDEIPFD